MKLKRVSKSELVDSTKEERSVYQDFVRRTRPKFEERGNGALFQPKVRGYRKNLVPALEDDPCELCAEARYNRLCTQRDVCAPLIFSLFNKLQHLNTNFVSAAILSKESKCTATPAKSSNRTTKQKGASSAGKRRN